MKYLFFLALVYIISIPGASIASPDAVPAVIVDAIKQQGSVDIISLFDIDRGILESDSEYNSRMAGFDRSAVHPVDTIARRSGSSWYIAGLADSDSPQFLVLHEKAKQVCLLLLHDDRQFSRGRHYGLAAPSPEEYKSSLKKVKLVRQGTAWSVSLPPELMADIAPHMTSMPVRIGVSFYGKPPYEKYYAKGLSPFSSSVEMDAVQGRIEFIALMSGDAPVVVFYREGP